MDSRDTERADDVQLHHCSESHHTDTACDVHLRFMSAALDVAREALDAGEVPVGCVFVLGNEIIAWGRNRTNEACNATRHAEIEVSALPVLSFSHSRGRLACIVKT